MVLRILPGAGKILNTGLSPSLAVHSGTFFYPSRFLLLIHLSQQSYNTTPPCGGWFGLFRFRSPLLAESL